MPPVVNQEEMRSILEHASSRRHFKNMKYIQEEVTLLDQLLEMVTRTLNIMIHYHYQDVETDVHNKQWGRMVRQVAVNYVK